mgnify:CR=1 FL=1
MMKQSQKRNNKILNFYKQTSTYTDLGYYKDFARKLPDDINELCLLQRRQIIHPFVIKENEGEINEYYGDLSKIPAHLRIFEDDLYPTAISVLAELLRRDNNYGYNRKVEDKIHVTCRGEAILLASILKAKGIAARVRSGFGFYVSSFEGGAGDHWITEYYNKKEKRWILVDPDFHDFDSDTEVDSNDIKEHEFLTAARAYLGIRNKIIPEKEIYYASTPYEYGLKAAVRALYYDFNSLMNNEIFFLHLPEYAIKNDLKLNKKELKELDFIANLMLKPNENFDELKKIWTKNNKFKVTSGGFN